MSRENIVTRDISDLCTDEIDLKFIEDVHGILGDMGTQTLLDRANAALWKLRVADQRRESGHTDVPATDAEVIAGEGNS